MKFSIVTPFYNNNKGNYIQNIYKSVIGQTYGDFEWIITDDFSTDGTKEKLLKLDDSRIRYIDQKHKKELFINPQTYATGDIVVQLDSDDEILPKTLEVLKYFFEKYPDVLVITPSTNYYTDGKFTDNMILYHEEYNNCLDKKLNKDFIRKKFFRTMSLIKINCCWGTLQAWRNIPIEFNEYGFENLVYMDQCRILNLEEKGKYLHIPRTLFKNNFRLGSVSHVFYTDDETDDNKLLKLINRRRKSVIESYVKDYDRIFHESQPFLYSGFNNETERQNVSLFSEEDLSGDKKDMLRDLYFDHNLFFNEVRDDIDYYFFMVRKHKDKIYGKNYDKEFIEICKKLNIVNNAEDFGYIKDIIETKKFKEVVIQHTPSFDDFQPIGLKDCFDEGDYYEFNGFEIMVINGK